MSASDIVKTLSEPLNKLLVPVASSAGTTLQDAWELVFGGFGTYVEKKRIARTHDLMEFKKSLETHVAAIPDNRLCEPKLAIVGPALEASKYYFEEPELREMFAKLISASMDSNTAPSVHPSFTEIIKQMSPLDAQNLALFEGSLPIAEYQLKMKEGGYRMLASNIFLANPAVKDLALQAQSISSLEHLGLIGVSYESYFTDKSVYSGFTKTPMYRRYETMYPESSKGTLSVQSGLATITPLGESFKKICLA